MKLATLTSLALIMSVLFFTLAEAMPAAKLAPDFYIFKTDRIELKRVSSSGAVGCRENIAKVICLADQFKPNQKPEDRICLDGGAAYATHFEQLYDAYPPAMQKMFCSLDYIFIEKTFHGTAYAGPIQNAAGETTGASMGIRQSVLDEGLNLTTWSSWKEQLSFGGIKDSYTLTAGLPVVQTSSKSRVNDFLYFVISHEFGHIFDFANGLNKTEACSTNPADDDSADCNLAPGTWGSIGWVSTRIPKIENEFVARRGLCFYRCEQGTLEGFQAPPLYATMDQTDFVSTYASQQPWDDFAESLAYYLMDQNLQTRYVLKIRDGGDYDIIAKLKSPIFARKLDYLKNFLSRTDIVYP